MPKYSHSSLFPSKESFVTLVKKDRTIHMVPWSDWVRDNYEVQDILTTADRGAEYRMHRLLVTDPGAPEVKPTTREDLSIR